MNETDQRMWAERVLKAVNCAFSVVEFPNWNTCDILLPHAKICSELIEKYGFEFEEASRLLNQAGSYQYERAFYSEAEPMYRRALSIFKKAIGGHHPSTITVSENLAALRGNEK